MKARAAGCSIYHLLTQLLSHLIIVDLDVRLCGSLYGHGEFLGVTVLGAHGEVSSLADDATLQ